MTRAATMLADPCTGARRRDFAGPASWPTRRGTSPIMVLMARVDGWLLPTSWPAWPAYSSSRPDTWRVQGWDAPPAAGLKPPQGDTDASRPTGAVKEQARASRIHDRALSRRAWRRACLIARLMIS